MTNIEIVNFARKFVGTKETANNGNPYGAYFKCNNVAYCSIFVSYVLKLTGFKTLYNLCDSKGRKRLGSYTDFNTYCPSIQQHFKENGQLRMTKGVAGDIVLFHFNSVGKVAIHVGILVSHDEKTGKLVTIEANTSSGTGSPNEGDGTFEKTNRHISQVAGFITPRK